MPIPNYRRWLFWCLLTAGAPIIVLGSLQRNDPARTNIVPGGSSLARLGVVVR
jgi:hypothetical protein